MKGAEQSLDQAPADDDGEAEADEGDAADDAADDDVDDVQASAPVEGLPRNDYTPLGSSRQRQ